MSNETPKVKPVTEQDLLQDAHDVTPGEHKPANPIAYAIEHRLPLAFTYHDKPRLVHPHRLGIAHNGNRLLRAYEVTKASEPSNKWKLYSLKEIPFPTVRIDLPTFTPAPGYTPSDKNFASILYQVPYEK